jgi:hypothetical protein
MHDAGAMRGGQCARDLNGDVNGLSQSERGVLQPLTHRLAFDELRRDEASALIGAYLVDGDDVRMIQSRSGASFLLETAQPGFVTVERFGQELERDAAAQTCVLSQIHIAHPARAYP